MFVKIDNYKNMNDVDMLIKNARNSGNLSPEFAMDVLRTGNYYGNIKKLARIIEGFDKNKWGEYKEFVLSCVDGREISDETRGILLNMAEHCGFEEEFNKIDKKEKVYGAKRCKVCYRKGKSVQEDLSDFDVLYHEHDYDVCVWDSKLPKMVDFSSCKCGVDFNMADCSEVKKFSFADNYGKIRFIHIGRPIDNKKKGAFPKVLDLSEANFVTFDMCDFEGVEEIKFKHGSVVTFVFTSNHPKKLDFSMCSDLVGDFHALDVEEIVFKDKNHEEVFMKHIHNFSGKVTLCEELEKEVEEREKGSNIPLWKKIFSGNSKM